MNKCYRQVLTFTMLLVAISSRALAAPDNTRGMALLAVVGGGDEGQVILSSGLTSFTRVDAGRYEITFDRSIEDCYVVATARSAGIAISASTSGGDLMLVVSRRSSDLALVDSTFTAVIYCQK